MNYVRTGQPLGGAWIVQLPKKGASEATSVTFAYVDGGFPELDALYVPLRTPTRGWRDYSCELVENAEAKWFSLIDRYSKK